MDAILQGLRTLPDAEAHAEFHLSQFKADGRSDIPPEILRDCNVLIEEAWPWNGNKTLGEAERALLPEDCATVLVPALHFNSLWPLLANDPRNRPGPGNPYGVIPYAVGDRLAVQVIKEVTNPAERLAAYFDRNPTELIDIERLHQVTMDEFFRRERGCDVRVAAYVLENFRKRRLFFTHAHPTPDLLRFVLIQIYGHPAVRDLFEPSSAEAGDMFDQWARTTYAFVGGEAPIHPAVAEHFGLQWYDPTARYSWNGDLYSFEEWIAFYLSYSST